MISSDMASLQSSLYFETFFDCFAVLYSSKIHVISCQSWEIKEERIFENRLKQREGRDKFAIYG